MPKAHLKLAKSPSHLKRDDLRAHYRHLRASLSEQEQDFAEKKIVERARDIFSSHSSLKSYVENTHVSEADAGRTLNIATFLSCGGEIRTKSLIEAMWACNINVYLPVLHPFSKGHLLFLHYSQKSAMRPNKYGILEPVLDVRRVLPPKQLDVIFTPLVAFDELGNRLGMGGGYYDRTLNALKSANESHAPRPNPKIVGLAHDCQQADTIPIESWDMPLDELITPSLHLKF